MNCKVGVLDLDLFLKRGEYNAGRTEEKSV